MVLIDENCLVDKLYRTRDVQVIFMRKHFSHKKGNYFYGLLVPKE